MAQNSKWVYPLALSSLAYGVLRSYTRPSSFFIRKVGVSVVALLGFQLGARYERKQYNLFLLRNYHLFDQRFKDALETGDSRYMMDFLEAPVATVEQIEEQAQEQVEVQTLADEMEGVTDDEE